MAVFSRCDKTYNICCEDYLVSDIFSLSFFFSFRFPSLHRSQIHPSPKTWDYQINPVDPINNSCTRYKALDVFTHGENKSIQRKLRYFMIYQPTPHATQGKTTPFSIFVQECLPHNLFTHQKCECTSTRVYMTIQRNSKMWLICFSQLEPHIPLANKVRHVAKLFTF